MSNKRKRQPRVPPSPAPPKQPEAFVIETALVVGLLNYLAQRPFFEVQELIPALQQLQPHESPEPAEPEPGPA